MPYKVPQSKVKARMLREVAAKQHQLTQLYQEHSSLLFQHSLLTATCELLRWIRAQQLPHPCVDANQQAEESSSRSSSGDSSCSTLLADEQELLQQLQELRCCSVAADIKCEPGPAGHAAPAAVSSLDTKREPMDPTPQNEVTSEQVAIPADAADQQLRSCSSSGSVVSSSNAFRTAPNTAEFAGVPTSAAPPAPAVAAEAQQRRPPALHDSLSPPDDVMLFCRRLMMLPRWSHLALGQLQEDYATTVCELSLNLAMLEQPHLQATCCAENPAAVVERLVCRHFHQLVSLVLSNRNELVMAFYLSNCLSGAVGEGMHKPALIHTVQQLQLTPEQQQRIADGEVLFKRLLAPIIQARQQLQGVGFSSSATHLQRSSSYSSSGSSSFAADAAALIDGFEAMNAFPARASALQQEQTKVANLSTLMNKELLLKACLCCFTLGCLSWGQAARLLITTFPFPPPVAALSQEISEQWQQQRKLAEHYKKQCQPAGTSKHHRLR